MEKLEQNNNTNEIEGTQAIRTIDQIQQLKVAGLQSQNGQSFVARRGLISKSIPSSIRTKAITNSKHVTQVLQNIQNYDIAIEKQSAATVDKIVEENKGESSNSCDYPLIKTATIFPDSDLMNFDL